MTHRPPLTDPAREALVARLVAAFGADERVRAAWLSGADGRGEADGWSDLDLAVAVADERYEEIVAAPEQLFALGGEVLLVQANFPSDSIPGGRFWLVVYEGSPHIDWNVGKISQAVRPEASLVVFERDVVPVAQAPEPPGEVELREMAQKALEFFWAMAPIALKYAARGHTRRAVEQARLLEGGYTRLWRAVNNPRRLAKEEYDQNRRLEQELEVTMPRFGVTIDPMEAVRVIRAFCAAVEGLHPALAALGVGVDPRLPGEVERLAVLALEAASRGEPGPDVGSRR
jgi:hypothetical protein